MWISLLILGLLLIFYVFFLAPKTGAGSKRKSSHIGGFQEESGKAFGTAHDWTRLRYSHMDLTFHITPGKVQAHFGVSRAK